MPVLLDMPGYDHAPNREDTEVLGSRIGAQILDSLVMVSIFVFTTFFLGGLGGSSGNEGAAGGMLVGIMLGFAGSVVYGLLLERMWDGYTVGKKLFGIKVVKENGDQCGLGNAFIRNLFEFIDGMFYYLIGFLVMAFSDKRQRIGDRLAGTVVVKANPTSSPSSTPQATEEPA